MKFTICPYCKNNTLEIKIRTNRNYKHGKNSKPTHRIKYKWVKCLNKKCNYFNKYRSPPLSIKYIENVE